MEFRRDMLQSILFLILAGVPIFLFLRRIRALKLSWAMRWC